MAFKKKNRNVSSGLGFYHLRGARLNRMHVVDGDMGKGTEKANVATAETAAADAPTKAVSVAASTTVEDSSNGGGDGPEAEAKPPPSPKVNGVCDSAGDGANNKARRSSKEDSIVSQSKDAAAHSVNNSRAKVKQEEEEVITVESSEPQEPQDLTVTCTSSFDSIPKPFPTAKYISISVEQCQTTPSSNNNSNNNSILDNQKRPRSITNRKRSTKSSDSDENGYKRSRPEDRESIVSEFVDKASSAGLDELTRHTELLQQEIHGLSALARSKELEWNDVIRMKKLKEEMYLRLVRRKQLVLMSMGTGSRPPDGTSWDFALENRMSEFFTSDEVSLNRVKQPRLPSNLTITKSTPSGTSQQLQRFLLHPQRQEQQHQQANRSLKASKTGRSPFPILPKPSQADQMSAAGGVGRQAGSQGPIVDVKSLIADYRQSHPETIPRRGRRTKYTIADNMVSSSRGVLSMSSVALGSGSQVRTVGSTSGPEETSRPSSADSSRSDALPFKDVLVQMAKMSNSSLKPPPPYPEVTLHPVLPGTSQSPPPHSSLLHGILTKSGAAGTTTTATTGNGTNKPTAFSPTLARLLTTPDRPSTTTTITTAMRGTGTSSSSSTGAVSISELLSTSKKRNELTITPVISHAQPAKGKEDFVSGSQEEDQDDSDRLVIDEGEDADNRVEDSENEPPEVVPQCQGCHQKPAQFVCAGCGNQWYCSRNCQVAAWDEHSDVCSG